MDPVTTAILAAAPALASDLVSDAVKSTYHEIKEIIRRRWGTDSAIDEAIANIEDNPTSKGRALILEEEITRTEALSDPELMHAVYHLIDLLKQENLHRGVTEGVNIEISGGTVQGVIGSK